MSFATVATGPVPYPVAVDLLKRSAGHHAQLARNAAKFSTNPYVGPCDQEQSKSWALAEWRRRRDAECAVSRLLRQRWTAEGAS